MKTMIQVLMMVVLAGSPLYGQSDEAPPPIPAQEDPEVLNQGPIHEGFAQPLDLAPQAGIISPDEPPASITENPAAERPKSSSYVWIPGYWAWDTERTDYVWVSGCWRMPPTGMSWMPGYWNKVPQGWQWVAGFWIPTPQAKQIQYLPAPPELVEVQAPAVTVVSGTMWVPPCYYWRGNSYVLRQGYWLESPSNWVWVPSHYTWTPRGYVFVSGYWDHVLTTRGVLYAPVYFPRHYYRAPGFSYSLGVVVNVGNLEFSLFSSPRYCHYYFGDYYSDVYVGLGIYPWFEFEMRHGWYDPIYVHDRCHYRRSMPHWDEHIRHEYDLRRADSGRRPPRTYREIESRPEGRRNDMRMVEPIRTYADRKEAPFKFSQMNDRERQKVVSQTNDVNNFRRERRQVESGQPAPSAGQSSRGSRVAEKITPEQRPRTAGTSEQARPAGTSGADRSSGRGESAPTAAQPTRESKSPTQGTPERSSRTAERPAEQARQASSSGTERSSERAPSERQGAAAGGSSERMNYSKSPVTGRSSNGGLFRESTPSQPESERNMGRERSGAGESRGESRGVRR